MYNAYSETAYVCLKDISNLISCSSAALGLVIVISFFIIP